MHVPPPPNARDLLPPLLACLPTSFVSPGPPPALLPLLSPLLRQRVTYLTGNTGEDGWLRLLSWSPQHRASKLPAVVERIDLEPHPVSGELEIEEPGPAMYRRLDEETLHARLEVAQFHLLPIFVWCEKDEHGGTEPGWKLSELRTLDERDDGCEWFERVSDATAFLNASPFPFKTFSTRTDAYTTRPQPAGAAAEEDDDDNDYNDDYWESYDRTPARTPAQKSPAPALSSLLQATSQQHDRNEAIREQAGYLRSLLPHADWKLPHDSGVHTAKERSISGEQGGCDLSMPRPISPAASQTSVDMLEERTRAMRLASDSSGGAQQLAIKQHISTSVKSLFRLAKASGIDREEFERIVRTDLEVLEFLEQGE